MPFWVSSISADTAHMLRCVTGLLFYIYWSKHHDRHSYYGVLGGLALRWPIRVHTGHLWSGTALLLSWATQPSRTRMGGMFEIGWSVGHIALKAAWKWAFSSDRRTFHDHWLLVSAEADSLPIGYLDENVPVDYGVSWWDYLRSGLSRKVALAKRRTRLRQLARQRKIVGYVGEVRLRIPRATALRPTEANRQAVSREIAKVLREKNVRRTDAVTLEAEILETYFLDTMDDVLSGEYSLGVASEPRA